MPNLTGTLWLNENFPGVNFLQRTTIETERPEQGARHRVNATFEFMDADVAIQFKLANS